MSTGEFPGVQQLERAKMLRARFGNRVRQKGDPQTPAMEFAALTTWLVMLLRGAYGSIIRQLNFVEHHKQFKKLEPDDQLRFRLLRVDVEDALYSLKQTEREIAEFNRTKKLRKV